MNIITHEGAENQSRVQMHPTELDVVLGLVNAVRQLSTVEQSRIDTEVEGRVAEFREEIDSGLASYTDEQSALRGLATAELNYLTREAQSFAANRAMVMRYRKRNGLND